MFFGTGKLTQCNKNTNPLTILYDGIWESKKRDFFPIHSRF